MPAREAIELLLRDLDIEDVSLVEQRAKSMAKPAPARIGLPSSWARPMAAMISSSAAGLGWRRPPSYALSAETERPGAAGKLGERHAARNTARRAAECASPGPAGTHSYLTPRGIQAACTNCARIAVDGRAPSGGLIGRSQIGLAGRSSGVARRHHSTSAEPGRTA